MGMMPNPDAALDDKAIIEAAEKALAEIIEDGPVKAGLERGRCRSAHAA